MQQLQGWRKFDDWGSQSAIAEFLSETPGPRPVSELWFGNHPDGPTLLKMGNSGRPHRAGSEEGPWLGHPLRLWNQSSLPHEGHRTR